MDFKKLFYNEILHAYPREQFVRIRAEIESCHQAIRPDISFARHSSNPVDRRLEFCACFLATIKALENRGESFEQIRKICLNVTESYVRPRNHFHRWIKRMPARLIATPIGHWIARIIAAKVGKKGHPDGFLVKVITDPNETHGLGYGMDILECGITKLFRKHGAAQYVPILCEVDQLTSSLAGLELVRNGTLATGADKCDFRFKRLGSSK